MLVAGALALTACGGSSSDDPKATPATTVATSAASTTVAPGGASTTLAVTKVSANTATREQLIRALEGAGVPNASRWAGEIIEYRPYPTDDPTLGKLQRNLAKYNPSPDTLSGILSVLQP